MILIIVGVSVFWKEKDDFETNKLMATVVDVSSSKLTVRDQNDTLYTFQMDDISALVGDSVVIEYVGLLDESRTIQTNEIVNFSITVANTDNSSMGIFSNYYTLASNKLKSMSLDEKIGQLLLVRYPDSGAINDLKKYNFGGFVFFEKDFRGKTEKEVKDMVLDLQDNANIPLLMAVDEEGGQVVRVSSNSNLVPSKFKSSQELYSTGGFDLIKEDTIEKSKILKNLGLNLNLAPVVDVSTDVNDYMYERSFGKNTELTSTYAKTVIEASKGTGVSYTLKHFPGYGNNADTHQGTSVDNRTLEEIRNNDLPPFEAGIKASAEAVLVSHNIVSSIDSVNPASLSKGVHELLRDDLSFTGVIITDDLAMGAVSSISNATVKAILAGNDIIITTDYVQSFTEIKDALNDGTLFESDIDKVVTRILAWKYYKGLMFDNLK